MIMITSCFFLFFFGGGGSQKHVDCVTYVGEHRVMILQIIPSVLDLFQTARGKGVCVWERRGKECLCWGGGGGGVYQCVSLRWGGGGSVCVYGGGGGVLNFNILELI